MVSCKPDSATKQASTGSYFDLSSVIQKDMDANTENGCGELKSVLVNGIKETKKLDSIDWRKELQPLLECAINKPAWKGKFVVDTLASVVSGQYGIQYKPTSDKINIKLLQANFVNGRIDNIYIIKQIRSFIFSSTQTIQYYPEKGFSIRGEQKAAMMENFQLNVNVKYNCK